MLPLTSGSPSRAEMPFSAGMRAAGLIFVAGQVPVDSDGTLVGLHDYTRQTTQVLNNIQAVLQQAGASLRDVVAVNSYLANRSGVDAYNEAYSTIFGDHKPTRVTVIAELVRPEYLVEMSAVAIDRTADPRLHT